MTIKQVKIYKTVDNYAPNPRAKAIAKRARELWLEAGEPTNCAEMHWTRAEDEYEEEVRRYRNVFK